MSAEAPPARTAPAALDEREVLDEVAWRERARAHEARADAFTAGWRSRRGAQTPHVIDDFLFTYYPTRPTKVRLWHPGAGVILEGAGERLAWRGYRAAGEHAVAADTHSQTRAHAADAPANADAHAPADTDAPVEVDAAALLRDEHLHVGWIEGLLRRTLDREARFSCFGLHEWAMVYRQRPEELRHQSVPLRLGHEATDAVVEAHDITCTHFDAYRFFTPEAEPRNRLRPTRQTQPDLEQSGCLHAGMDLYKWALKLGPLVPGELLLDAFALARDIRELDMRASPYDVSGYGLAPVAIETPEGKREYAEAQRGFAERGDGVRRRLLDAIALARRVADRT